MKPVYSGHPYGTYIYIVVILMEPVYSGHPYGTYNIYSGHPYGTCI